MSDTDINRLAGPEIAGQLVMPRIDFNEEDYLEQALRYVEKYHVAGFIIFNGEINQVRETVLELQSKSNIPLLFGIDAERGLGQIVKGGTRFPFLMSQGASSCEQLAERQAVNTAAEMKYCGLNLLFAPVLDINTNPNNPIVNVRAFGDDPGLVSRLASSFYRKIKSEGVFACGKHFPGHGSTDADSHVELPVLNKTLKELLESELVPFKKAVDEGIDFIMAGHIGVDGVDSNQVPAIFSKTLVTEVLRNTFGFRRIVITDSFRMDALKELGTESDIAIKSIIAGCDVILDPVNSEDLINSLSEKIKNDEAFRLAANESAGRLFEIKKQVKEATEFFPEIENSEKLVSEIARTSACIVKGGPLNSGKVEVNIFDVMKGGEDLCRPFIDQMKINGFEIESVKYISEDYDFNYKNRYDTVNIVATTVSAWTRYLELTNFYHKVLTHIYNQNYGNKILISFGSPYVITDFLDYNNIIVLFEIIEPCQKAAADVLAGKIVSNAKLPIKF